MRLHHLTVTAFGPFAGTEKIDFDDLNEAGLFLLTGDTGAGKSSLLDAVCFALYGVVPGVRGVKTLKSQHAPADAPPEVVLDVTLQTRRFVVRRSPEWTRPKKRGEGFITEKASASILETTGGGEHLLSARAAEVGVLMTSLMGMTATQFQQVALLPQGEFQTFLRASSQERHDVLQHLFRTNRFERIEDWVNDHSRRLHERSLAGEATARRLVDTLTDRAGCEPPDELLGESLARSASDGLVLPWASALVEVARAAVGTATAEQDQASAAVEELHGRHEHARRVLARRERAATAHRALAALADTAEAAVAATDVLHAHERAGRCVPVLDLLRQALSARDLAGAELTTVLRPLRMTPGVAVPTEDEQVSSDALSEMLDAARRRGAKLEALVPREEAAAVARAEQRRDELRLREAERILERADLRAAELPGDVRRAAHMLAEATVAAAREEALTLSLEAARRRQHAVTELVSLHGRLAEAEDAHRDARDRVQDARELVQELMARRLSGMAAELAGALEAGTACPVCGGVDHPHPALPSPEPVTATDQESADSALAVRAADLEAAEAALHDVQARRQLLTAAAEGATPAEAVEAVRDLERQLAVATDARRRVEPSQQRLDTLHDERDTLAQRRTAAAAQVAALRQAVTTHARTAEAAEAEIASVLGDTEVTVMEAATATSRAAAGLESALRAREALDAAARHVDDLTGQADSAARTHGFLSAVDVQGALVPDDERTTLTALLQERADAEARARAVLDEVQASAAADVGDAEAADLEALAAELSDAEAAAARGARALGAHEERLTALTLQLGRLREALDAWAPLRDEALRAESMSRLVRGMGHDNQLQMRLSAYVLATRLDQVVAAANDRLGQMRDQRYLLQRTGQAERRSARAGLGLEIVDQWTGDVRAPTTLSGGETFVVSLALALGLADVVTHEAGGTEVETLFVDEGFGTLDANTLDDVMDRLDGLRAGGRTVGVVSHVSELRSRIPTQVQVDKGRAGSTVSVRTLVG
jgi:exonuclease SbcC